MIRRNEIRWDSYSKDLHESGVAHSFRASVLIKRLKEQRLNGKLKEIASTLKEDDNPVLMMAKFK